MKRRVFFLVFILIAFAFFYSPIEKVVGQTQECFTSGGTELVSQSENPGVRSAGFLYEGITTGEWEFSIYSNDADVLVKRMNVEGNLYVEPIFGTEVSGSTNTCKYFTFDFSRNAGSVSFDIPLTDEIMESGVKKCVYVLPDSVIDKINALGGRGVTEVSQICPDLQSGRAAEGDSCALSASCVVNVQQGTQEKFGYKLAIDECGQRKIYADKNGEPLIAGEEVTRAQQFVSECSTQTSGGVKNANARAAPPSCIHYELQGFNPYNPTGSSCYYLPVDPGGFQDAGFEYDAGHVYYYNDYECYIKDEWMHDSALGCPDSICVPSVCNCRDNSLSISNNCQPVQQSDPPVIPIRPAQPQRPECNDVRIVDLKHRVEVPSCTGPVDDWQLVSEGDSFPAGEAITFKVNTDPSDSFGGCELNGGALVDCNLNPNPGVGPLEQDAGNDLCRTVWTPDENYFIEESDVALEYRAWCTGKAGETDTGMKVTNIKICPRNDVTGVVECELNKCGNGVLDIATEDCDGDKFFFRSNGLRLETGSDACKQVPGGSYSSGDLKCKNDCRIDFDECRENINGKLVVYGDLRKVIVGDALPANPDTKVYLDLDLEGVAAGKLPKKAVFKTRVEGAGFIVGPIGFRSYKNTFMGGWSAMLAKYAETTPDLFSLIKRAQDSGNFVPTGPIAKISDDGRTVVKVYSRDTVIFDEILDEWIEGWFLGNIVITMNFNADGSAEVITESSITTLENNYNSNKVNRVNVDAATARRILIDMLMRFDLAKSKPLGKNTGVWENAIPAPDVEEIKEMIAEGRYVDGAALPIDGSFDKRVDYINPVNENTSGGTALDYMKKLIEYLDSLRNGQQTSAAEDLDFVFFDTTVA